MLSDSDDSDTDDSFVDMDDDAFSAESVSDFSDCEFFAAAAASGLSQVSASTSRSSPPPPLPV